MVVPPRPVSALGAAKRPTRLTPPEVKRVPPPVAGVGSVSGVETPPLPAPKAPAATAKVSPTPAEVDTTAAVIGLDVPQEIVNGALSDPHPIMLDMAPVAHESQRMSGEVVGGSGIEQVVTKIALDQAAQAVEHSAGSALEALISGPGQSYHSESAILMAAEPAMEKSEWAAISPPQAERADPVSETFADIVVDSAVPAAVPRATAHARVQSPSDTTLSPMLFILCPLALLLTGVGVSVMLYSLLAVAPSDLADFEKMDFRLLALGKAFLGGMVFLTGLILFLAAGVTHLGSKVKALSL